MRVSEVDSQVSHNYEGLRTVAGNGGTSHWPGVAISVPRSERGVSHVITVTYTK